MQKFKIQKTVQDRVSQLKEYLSDLNYSIGMTEDTDVFLNRKTKKKRILNKLSFYKRKHPHDFITHEIHHKNGSIGYNIISFEKMGEGNYQQNCKRLIDLV